MNGDRKSWICFTLSYLDNRMTITRQWRGVTARDETNTPVRPEEAASSSRHRVQETSQVWTSRRQPLVAKSHSMYMAEQAGGQAG